MEASGDGEQTVVKLRQWLARISLRHPREGLRRVLVEDAAGTLVLMALRGAHHLMVAARAGAPLAAITQGAEELERAIREP